MTPAQAQSQPSQPVQPPPATPPPPVSAEVLLAAEIAAFERELPRLLAEGEEGRWALVKGNEVISVWDTFGDAVQAGHEKFGLEPFMVDKVTAVPRVARCSRYHW